MTAIVKIDTRMDTPTKDKEDKENKPSRVTLSREELESAKVYEAHGLAMLNDMLASDSLKTSLLAGNTAQEDFISMALLYCKAAAVKLGYVVEVERSSFPSLDGSRLITCYRLRLKRREWQNENHRQIQENGPQGRGDPAEVGRKIL